ncbi:MAG: lysophospholipid acyltransferase family protein [Spirochaetales bacterium]|nr:lysophospholipid acyltransferase family protein [Spirochaetales bacterium]
MKRTKYFNKGLYLFLKATAGSWFRIFYPVKITNPEIFREMKPPYLVLPNHVMKWDAVLLSNLFPDPLNCMVSESHYRKPHIAFFLSLLGAFPKAKAKSDLGAIRHMMDLKKMKKNICVYPEGQMSWDGSSLPLFYSTAKLIQLLKIPVYTPVFTGGSATFPRWGKARRRGPMELTIHRLFTDGKEIKSLSSDEIFKRMEDILNHTGEALEEKGLSYSSDARAEYLENVLFICPSCRGIKTISSEGNSVSCAACGFGAELDEFYKFRYTDSSGAPDSNSGQGGEFRPGTVTEWNRWQKEILPVMLENYRSGIDKNSPFMMDSEVEIKTGFRMEPLKTWTEKGDIALFQDHIMLRPEKGEMRLIPLKEISAVHVMTRQKLEFYHDRTLYVFFFPTLRVSGYKWLCALRTLGIPSSYAWHGEEVEKI